jgi:hypothetical protein
MLREICIVKKHLPKNNTILELALQLDNAHVICPAKELDEGCMFKGNFAVNKAKLCPNPIQLS